MEKVVVRLEGKVAGWMCEVCGGPRQREVSMNCSSVIGWCARTNWLCRVEWRSAMNLGAVQWRCA